MQKDDLKLYLVTDRNMANGRLEQIVDLAIRSGVTMVQLREKDTCFEEFCEKATQMKSICDSYGVPLIINDNVEVCLVTGADGVHLGGSDCDISVARSLLGGDKIIGASARDVQTAKLAEKSGADYLGVGAVFGTSTKSDAKQIDLDILREICNSVSIPVVAIGGVSEDNVGKLDGTGICGVAVVSSIIKAKDVAKTTEHFVEELDKIVKKT